MQSSNKPSSGAETPLAASSGTQSLYAVETPPHIRLIRMPELLDVTGYCRALAYEKIRQKLLPTPIHISTGSVAFPDFEIQAVIKARIAGAGDDEIRRLVAELESARVRKAQQQR